MPVFRWSELEPQAFEPEHSAGTGQRYAGQKIEVVRVRYPGASAVRAHAVPHEQVHAILQGRARYRVGGEERVVGPQDAILIRTDTEYAAQVLEPLEVVVFRDRLAARGDEPAAATTAVFFNWDAMQADFITPRYSSAHGPTLTGGRIEVSRMLLPTATEGKPHRHPNEQIQVVLSGQARAMIGGTEYLVETQGGVLFPSDVEHGAKITEDYLVLNCKDVVSGWSVYHARWEK
jgi:quercetin dioxygenase-like cupin family protein